MLRQKFQDRESNPSYSSILRKLLRVNSQLDMGKTIGQNKGAINKMHQEARSSFEVL